MSIARAMFAGPGACLALLDGACGEVELRVSGGAYVRLGSADWLLLARPSAPFGPLSVAVRGLDRLPLQPGAPARVIRDRLVLAADAVTLERMRVRRGTPIVAPSPRSADLPAMRRAAAAAHTRLPNPPAALLPGLAALTAGRVREAVSLLAGLGEGLTPAGDDVLAGYAAAHLTLAAPVALSPAAAGRSSALGLAYLRCAERGDLPEAGARLLTAICRGSVTAAQVSASRLRSWGRTSGAALGWGINAAVAQATATGPYDGPVGICAPKDAEIKSSTWQASARPRPAACLSPEGGRRLRERY
jgi:hypothetical protein